jgi:hypothetical protein
VSATVEHLLCVLVVALDYAALSWFPRLATLTGHPEAAFRVGTVLFIGVNAGLLVALDRRDRPARERRRASARATSLAGVIAAWPTRWIVFAALVTAAVVYRLSAIARTPLDPRLADMLPLISAASHKLLAGGNPYQRTDFFRSGPYEFYVLPEPSALVPSLHDLWLPYVPAWPPGLWLPYVPAVWAGFDLRLVGLLAALLIAVLLGVARWSPRREPDRATEEPMTGWFRLAPAGALLLAPAAVWFGAIGHTQTYWLYLTGLVWALSRRAWVTAGVCLGLCVMSRHTVLTLLPLVALYAWRCLTTSERWRLAASAVLVVVALALPFGMQGLWQFVIGSPIWYMKFGDQGWNGPRWWVTHTFGFSTFLYPVGLSRAVPWVGAALLMVVYGFAYRRVRDLSSCVRSLALTLLVVTVSVPTPFRYEFFPIILLLSTLPLLAPRRPDGGAAA